MMFQRLRLTVVGFWRLIVCFLLSLDLFVLGVGFCLCSGCLMA